MTLSKLEVFTAVIAICFVLFLLFGYNWIH